MSFLGDIGKALFGSGGDKGSLEVRTKDIFTEEQKRLANEILLPLLTRAIEQQPEFSPLERTSLAGLEEMAMAAAAGPAGRNLGGTGRRAIRGILNQGPQDFEDFFRTTVQAPALESFQRDIIPAIRARFAPQFFGGERREAEGRATEDLLESLVRARSSLAFQTQQQHAQNVLAAAGLVPSLIGAEQAAGANILASLLGAGTQARQSLAAEEQRRILNALSFLAQPQFENIAAGIPGRGAQTGILPAAAAGFAGGIAGNISF